jgi:hypothetical protein
MLPIAPRINLVVCSVQTGKAALMIGKHQTDNLLTFKLTRQQLNPCDTLFNHPENPHHHKTTQQQPPWQSTLLVNH